MRNRAPVARTARPPLPDFTPVPRKYRHDGWTPERQKAFIEALADCGSVTRAAAQVNMAQANCYALRRSPGAEEFRRAWDAALDFGVLRLKDIAFERAVEGELHPVFKGGKLMGFHRKKNDALLMFCLRHYGQDAGGKRTTINYFSSRASAGASAGAAAGSGPSTGSGRADVGGSALSPAHAELVEARAGAEVSTTTVRTVINGSSSDADPDEAARAMNAFEGVALDAEAQAAIAAALEACAARARAAEKESEKSGAHTREVAADDPREHFVREPPDGLTWRGEFVPGVEIEEWVPFIEDEPPWELAGADEPDWEALECPSKVEPAGASIAADPQEAAGPTAQGGKQR